MSGHRVVPQSVAHFYSATKYAVTALTEGLRQELREAQTHIRATVRLGLGPVGTRRLGPSSLPGEPVALVCCLELGVHWAPISWALLLLRSPAQYLSSCISLTLTCVGGGQPEGNRAG